MRGASDEAKQYRQTTRFYRFPHPEVKPAPLGGLPAGFVNPGTDAQKPKTHPFSEMARLNQYRSK
jgi:hypothetical protein